MSRYWFIPIVWIIFILEGTLFQWLIPSDVKITAGISPHIVLIVLLYIAIFLSHYMAVVLGLIFGLLHDFTYYGHMIGPFGFGLAVTAYFAGFITARSKLTLLSTMSVISLSILLFEHFLYGVYALFQVIDYSYKWTIIHIILPNTIFHLLFALAIYIPIRSIIDKMKVKRKSSSAE